MLDSNSSFLRLLDGMSPKAQWWLRGNLGTVVGILVFAFPVVTLTVNKSDSVILILLLILGVFSWLRDSFREILNKGELWLCMTVLALFAIALLSYCLGEWTDLGFRILGRYLRWLFFPFILLLFVRHRPSRRTVWWGLITGAYACGIYAIVEYCFHGQGSIVSADTSHIVFGDFCLLLGFMSLAGYQEILPENRFLRCLVLSGALVFSLAGSLLSGSRGGWIALPVLMAVWIVALRGRRGLIAGGSFILAVAALMVIAFLLPGLPASSRVADAWSSTREYFAYSGRIHELQGTNRCITNKFMLDGLVRHAHKSANAIFTVVKVRPKLIPYGGVKGCRIEYALLLSSNDDKNAWAGLVRTGPRGSFTTLLARGEGGMIFWPEKKSQAKLFFPAFTRIRTGPSIRTNQYLSLEIFDGGTMWIIPVEDALGEYRFFYAYSSAGTRFEMWRGAWNVFLHHKILGTGTGSWRVQASRLVSTGDYMTNINRYDHPHNQYFAELALRGVIGLATLALLFVVLFYICRSHAKEVGDASGFPLALLLFLAGMAVFFITETMLIHTIVIDWFVFTTALLVAMMHRDPGARQPTG